MLISTRGRYALRIMLDLAAQPSGEYISLKDIAARQDLSLKYLESIVALLAKGELLESLRGKTGGYRLSRPAEEYTVEEILRLSEGSLAPVACVEDDGIACGRTEHCISYPLWEKLNTIMNDYLRSVTLEALLHGTII